MNKKPKSAPHNQNSQPSRCGRTRLQLGHFQVVCHSTAKVGKVNQDDPNRFPGVVNTWDTVSNLWRLSLLLNGVLTEFDINTGAEVSVISENQHQKIGCSFISPLGK